jgi:isoleucyl-tRNA synthetase
VSVPVGERAGLAPLTDDIAEELNVHRVELADGTGDLVERSCKPNFRALGPAFQQRAPQVAAAISALDSDAAATLAVRLGRRAVLARRWRTTR